MKNLKNFFVKYNSLENFKCRLYFYTGLTLFIIDYFICKHNWFSSLYQIFIFPIIFYIAGAVVISIAWSLADYDEKLDNLIKKEIASNKNKDEL